MTTTLATTQVKSRIRVDFNKMMNEQPDFLVQILRLLQESKNDELFTSLDGKRGALAVAFCNDLFGEDGILSIAYEPWDKTSSGLTTKINQMRLKFLAIAAAAANTTHGDGAESDASTPEVRLNDELFKWKVNDDEQQMHMTTLRQIRV